MTDKNEFDQEELNVAFERLNQSEGLQPSAELDAMILKMAAEEVQGDSVEKEQSNVTDITDISFRRGQRETHKALKKKGLFPNWVMPMGLAATVLLSFGVVNRVLQSPEFDNLAKQSSYQELSDEVVVTSAVRKDNNTDEVASFAKPDAVNQEQKKRLESDNVKTTVTINDNEINADISFEKSPPSYTRPKIWTTDSSITREHYDGTVEHLEVQPHVFDNSEEFKNSEIESKIILADKLKQEQAQAALQEQHAILTKEKRERLKQARRSAPTEPENQMAPSQAIIVPETMPVPPVANAEVIVEETETEGAVFVESFAAEDLASGSLQAEIQAESLPSISKDDSFDEVVVTGARIGNAGDVEADSALETKRQTLESVLFEHKQCFVDQDCALVALACDSCDCLESVSNQNYAQYQSEFSQAEIAEQCFNTATECVRNYCQVQQSE